MTESNNVKFVEDNGKWLWKRYDVNGSVIHRSFLFDTEREAREDYQANGGEGQDAPSQPEAPVQVPEAGEATNIPSVPEESNAAGNVVPEGEMSAGTTSPDASQPSTDQTI